MSRSPQSHLRRPVVTLSLAFDYWLGQGYAPLYFHISTFFWFLAQLAWMYGLFAAILRRCWPDKLSLARPDSPWLGMTAPGHRRIRELHHPARGSDFDMLRRCEPGIYSRFLASRYGIYLAPFVIGVLAKSPVLIFPLLLFTYVFLVEERPGARALLVAGRKSAPALAAAVGLAVLQAHFIPKTFVADSASAYGYLITQPYVAFRYFTSFFLPLELSADTDLAPLASIWTLEAFGGLLFLAALVCVIAAAARRPRARPIGSLLWRIVAEKDLSGRGPRAVVAAALGCLLLLLALGTRRRNEVWRSEESLWRDVSIKSPRNGRGLTNYGLKQMAKGEYQKALLLFQQAAV